MTNMIIMYTLSFLLGLVIGSFLNICIYRIPRGEPINKQLLHCLSCGTRLKLTDIVPVLSYIFLKCRCRNCRAKIPVRDPAVEIITALVFTILFHKYGLSVDFFAFSFIMSILIAVFFIDIDFRIVPYGLVLSGLAGGALLVIYNLFYPVSIYADRIWWNPLLGMIIGSGFLLLVAIAGLIIYKTDDAMGMGDVMIFAPIGIFLGWRMTIVALLLSVFVNGFVSLMLMLVRKKGRKDTIPFGPVIVTCTFIAIVWGWDIFGWYMNRP